MLVFETPFHILHPFSLSERYYTLKLVNLKCKHFWDMRIPLDTSFYFKPQTDKNHAIGLSYIIDGVHWMVHSFVHHSLQTHHKVYRNVWLHHPSTVTRVQFRHDRVNSTKTREFLTRFCDLLISTINGTGQLQHDINFAK